jgi:hypothetical protein
MLYDYMVRHWRGELTLGRTYWMNCVVVSVAFHGVAKFFQSISSGFSSVGCALYELSFCLTVLVLSVWQIVGLWRASVRRAAMPDDGFVSWLGRGMAGLYVVALMMFTYSWLIPRAADAVSVFNDDVQKGVSTIELLPWGTAIEVGGIISPSSYGRFQALLNANPNVRVIYVNSTGGRIQEAIRIAEVIKKRGLDTYVSRMCISAGVLILGAGKSRVARDGAVIGLHGAYMVGVTLSDEEQEIINAAFVSCLRRLGAEEAFIKKAMKVSPAEMLTPGLDELVRQRLLTGVVDHWGTGYGADLKFLAESSTEEQWKKSFLEISGDAKPIMAALTKRFPKESAEIFRVAVRETRKGADMPSVIREFATLFGEALAILHPRGSDRSMQALAMMNYLILRDNGDVAPVDSLARAFLEKDAALWREDELRRRLPYYPTQENNRYTRALLEDASAPNDKETLDGENAAAKEFVGNYFKSAGLSAEDFGLVAKIEQFREMNTRDSRRLCRILEGMYARILTMPVEVQGGIMRALNAGFGN